MQSVMFILAVLASLVLSSNAFVPGSTRQHVQRREYALFASIDDGNYDDDGYMNDSDDSADEQYDTNLSNYVATCIPGLSSVLLQELQDIGCTSVEAAGRSAVCFQADVPSVLNALIWARVPHKIMELLCETDSYINNRQDLEEFVKSTMNVKDLLGNGQGGLLSLSVQVLLNNPKYIPEDINHSHFTALTIKNALCDVVRDMRGDRPDVDLIDPDVPLVAVVLGNQDAGAKVSIYRQIHVGSLHQRGYRRDSAIHIAAMKESMAAGLLYKAGFHQACNDLFESLNDDTESSPRLHLLDPMAGSGTFLLEGAMIAADLAPGLMRIKCNNMPSQQQYPPICRWKSADNGGDTMQVWKQLLLQASQRSKVRLQQIRNHPDLIHIAGNEMHSGAIELFDSALSEAGLYDLVSINQGDCANWRPVDDDTDSIFVVCNPPWGVRLTEDIQESWDALKIFLRNAFVQADAWILSGNADATRALRLRRSESMPIKTGQQDLRWINYKIDNQQGEDENMDEDEEAFDGESVPMVRPRSDTGRRSIKASSNRRSKSRSNDEVANEWLI